MLNQSGKAKLLNDRDGRSVGIKYHPDDLAEAIADFAHRFPAGTTIASIRRAGNRADFYAVVHDEDGSHRLQYVSKWIGAILGSPIYDGSRKTGIPLKFADPVDLLAIVADRTHGDRTAFIAQDIR